MPERCSSYPNISNPIWRLRERNFPLFKGNLKRDGTGRTHRLCPEWVWVKGFQNRRAEIQVFLRRGELCQSVSFGGESLRKQWPSQVVTRGSPSGCKKRLVDRKGLAGESQLWGTLKPLGRDKRQYRPYPGKGIVLAKTGRKIGAAAKEKSNTWGAKEIRLAHSFEERWRHETHKKAKGSAAQTQEVWLSVPRRGGGKSPSGQ